MAELNMTGGLTAAYQCSDIKRTADWYEKNLGFKLEYHLEDLGWCELKTCIENVYVGFSQVESPKVQGGPTLTWAVDNIEAARARLEANGVRFDGETIEIAGMVKLATFFDPDGNHLMFSQSLGEG